MNRLLKLFQFHGTATSWQAKVSVFLYLAVITAQTQSLAPIPDQNMFVVLGIATIYMMTTAARRLHHAGRTGRWAALTLVPIFGVLAAVIIAFQPQRRAQLNAHVVARVFGYLAMAMILLFSVLRIWWAPFFITTDSMKPTLLVGDAVIARLDGKAELGQVIVVRVQDQMVVQRVIGLPGDRVAVTAGQVTINGAPLLQFPNGRFDEVMGPQGPDQVRPRCENGVVGEGAICSASKLREVWPDGRSYQILNIETGFADDFAPATVPADTVFLMGDNRDTAIDSRYDPRVMGLGFVRFADVVGPATRILGSSEGSSLLQIWNWRWGRILRAVN